MSKQSLTEKEPCVDIEQAAAHYEAFLRSLGPILSEGDYAQSARRVAALMERWTSSVSAELPAISSFEAPENSGWVVMKGIAFHALCEHHMLPFFGHIDLAILPGESIAGFSSLVRLVEHLCRRPQLQEGLVADIVDAIELRLAPRGVLVRLSARQLCMEMQGRGIGTHCVSIDVRGVCRTESGRGEAISAQLSRSITIACRSPRS